MPTDTERSLWFAVLLRAAKDLAGVDLRETKSVRPLLRQKARGWISSLSTQEGSFVWICGMLELNPGSVRSHLLGLSPEDLRSRIKHLAPEGLGDRGIDDVDHGSRRQPDIAA